MKKTCLTLILAFMIFASHSQNYVYDGNGNKKTFSWEDLDIEFINSQINFPAKEGPEFAGLLAILPMVVDIGFQLTGKALENRAKSYTAEYTKQKSNMAAGTGAIPDFSLIRKIKVDNAEHVALKM